MQTYRRGIAILAIPLLLFVGITSARALYRCKYDVIMRTACCCPASAAKSAKTLEGPALRSGCCVVEIAPALRAPVATSQSGQPDSCLLDPPRVLALVAPDVPNPAPARLPIDALTARPPSSPPLILLKRSLLL